MKPTIVISLGGSILVPDEIDTAFLQKFKKLVLRHCRNYMFVIITGGGRTARRYIKAASVVSNVTQDDEDWLGIHATRLNAHLLRTIFREKAYYRTIKNPTEKITTKKPIIIAAGWKPGCSTDYDAVLLAKNIGVHTVINMTSVDWLYNKDPSRHRNAKKIKYIGWNGFKKIVGSKWTPGMNTPFDPIATRLAAKSKMRLLLLGKNLKNLERFLQGKTFKGSVVE